LLDELDFAGSVSAGTTYTNVATAFSAFGENQKALELFEKARDAYEAGPAVQPQLLGGLYNNMALTLTAQGHYEEAHALFDRAMEIMATVPGGVLEQAITCLNRADALVAERGMEEAEHAVFDLMDQAYDLLTGPGVTKNGYYAFVCEKCAPVFSYYGYFAAADELNREAESIYERS
ncbi:MAG: tetratricopeptide repeat protein, partial [Oscillospiraceae bacterium]|nr:tetratricopeptide repeat protein [Oscillospiraceae bacterium]